MNLQVDGKAVFAYTASRELDPKKPTVVFIHGAGDWQLFDLATDPLEQHNLWGVGEHAGEISRLKDAFIDWRQNSLLETMDLNAAAR